MVPVSYYLTLAAVLFTIGAVGVMIRKNAIVVFMCIELMLNSVNLTLVAISRGMAGRGLAEAVDGQIMVFFVMVVAAAEAAVGLAIMLSVFRVARSIETDEVADLKY